MIKDIMKDPLFLAQKSTDATKADQCYVPLPGSVSIAKVKTTFCLCENSTY